MKQVPLDPPSPIDCEFTIADLWTGCDFGCAYCLPAVRRWARKFPTPDGTGLGQTTVQPRTCDPLNIAQLSKLRAKELVRTPMVQLSCLSDPYPRLEETAGRTRRAIALLHRYQVGVVVQTKSGMRAVRDFQPRAVAKPTGPAGTWRPPRSVNQASLTFTDGDGWDHPPDLGSHPGDGFGASLTFLSEDDSRKWEPRAALPSERMEGLEEAHRRGIPTLAALSPVIDPEQTLELIRLTSSFVTAYIITFLDHFGMLPALAAVASFDWQEFAAEALDLCNRLGVQAYVREQDPEADRLGREQDKTMDRATWVKFCQASRPEWKPLSCTPDTPGMRLLVGTPDG